MITGKSIRISIDTSLPYTQSAAKIIADSIEEWITAFGLSFTILFNILIITPLVPPNHKTN